jgi:hypothetical protein
MSLRDWRTRRIFGLSLVWMLGLFAWLAIVAALRTRQLERDHPAEAIYMSVRLPGGGWTLLGPPVILVAAWLWSRRSRPAS